MKRLFAAIKVNPSEGFLKAYYGLQTNLRNEKIKWANIDNIHITLKFFGETTEEKIPGIKDKLESIAAKHSSFSIDIKDIGIFGSSYKPRVIWFGINENKSLTKVSSLFSRHHKPCS